MKVKSNVMRLATYSFGLVYLLSVLLAAQAVFAAEGQSFADVPEDNANYRAIEYLKEQGVVEGYEDGQYLPGEKINRAEFTKIIVEGSEYRDSDYVPPTEGCFPDVTDQWFAAYVCLAQERGLVDGYPDGNFRPEDEVNFAEASKIIANAMQLEVLDDNPTPWYRRYVEALDAETATPDTIANFEQKITRGEMAEMIWRIHTEPAGVNHVSYAELSGEKTDTVDSRVAASAALTTFDSCLNLETYVKDNGGLQGGIYYFEDDVAEESDAGATPLEVAPQAKSELGAANSASADYSGTNVQVEGVDEADIVKTDGEFIYLIKGSEVRVVKAYPTGSMEEYPAVNFEKESTNFSPREMYVDGDRLVVIGDSYNYHYDDPVILESESESSIIAPPFYSGVTVYIFDISEKDNLELARKLEYEGYYTSSRKVDDRLYMVTGKHGYYYGLPEEYDGEDFVPLMRDSEEDDVRSVNGCDEVLYYPPSRDTSTLTVSSIPVDDVDGEVSNKTIMGSTGTVYSSRDNLYIAAGNWDYWYEDGNEETTDIHKFSLGEEVNYQGHGVVPGHLLNQFSMDENDGYFRVATTIGDLWNEETPSQNNIYILDEDMEVVGNIENIAPGERIYSVRFIGDRGYMVTFKKVDPFFVIDLEDPRDPEILGKLKIPGYSDYLHPLDENHIIGFGKDAVEALEDEEVSRGLDFAWYQGMKVAMFDVTDVSNPIELHKISIGDRGTDSPLLWNHKALYFEGDRGLMAFPVTLAEISESEKTEEIQANTYGEFVSQGAHVYEVSVEDGFEFKGLITHYDQDEVEKKAGHYWYGNRDVERVLRIGEYLYTVSQAVVQANDISDLEEVGSVQLKD